MKDKFKNLIDTYLVKGAKLNGVDETAEMCAAEAQNYHRNQLSAALNTIYNSTACDIKDVILEIAKDNGIELYEGP